MGSAPDQLVSANNKKLDQVKLEAAASALERILSLIVGLDSERLSGLLYNAKKLELLERWIWKRYFTKPGPINIEGIEEFSKLSEADQQDELRRLDENTLVSRDLAVSYAPASYCGKTPVRRMAATVLRPLAHVGIIAAAVSLPVAALALGAGIVALSGVTSGLGLIAWIVGSGLLLSSIVTRVMEIKQRLKKPDFSVAKQNFPKASHYLEGKMKSYGGTCFGTINVNFLAQLRHGFKAPSRPVQNNYRAAASGNAKSRFSTYEGFLKNLHTAQGQEMFLEFLVGKIERRVLKLRQLLGESLVFNEESISAVAVYEKTSRYIREKEEKNPEILKQHAKLKELLDMHEEMTKGYGEKLEESVTATSYSAGVFSGSVNNGNLVPSVAPCAVV